MMDEYLEHARQELAPKMAVSAYVVTVAPGEIDPKIAIETGYAVLLNKPILVVVEPGRQLLPGLRRIASEVVELTAPLASEAGRQELTDALLAFAPKIAP